MIKEGLEMEENTGRSKNGNNYSRELLIRYWFSYGIMKYRKWYFIVEAKLRPPR